MYTLTLHDGTQMQTSGAGASEGSLWIYGLTGGFVELAEAFSDPEKTQTVSVFYQQDLPTDVFEGYTILRAIMMDEDAWKVCMKKAA